MLFGEGNENINEHVSRGLNEDHIFFPTVGTSFAKRGAGQALLAESVTGLVFWNGSHVLGTATTTWHFTSSCFLWETGVFVATISRNAHICQIFLTKTVSQLSFGRFSISGSVPVFLTSVFGKGLSITVYPEPSSTAPLLHPGSRHIYLLRSAKYFN